MRQKDALVKWLKSLVDREEVMDTLYSGVGIYSVHIHQVSRNQLIHFYLLIVETSL